MSDIKAGTVAFMKTTGEPVFVLAITDTPHIVFTGYELDKKGALDYKRPKNTEVSPVTVYVRRANHSNEGGTYHGTETYTLQELETQEEQKRRFIAEREELRAHFAGQNGQAPAIADLGFGQN